jgi:hypothetical protein
MRRLPTSRHARARTAPLPLLAAASVLVLGLLGTACGGTADAEDALPAPEETSTTETTAAPETTSTTTLTPEQEVEAKYREMWDAVIVANNPSEPTSPALSHSMAGDSLQQAIAETTRNESLGLALRLPENSISSVSDVKVVVDGLEAQITACVIDDAVLFDPERGTVLNDRVVSGRTVATAVETSNGWRISNNAWTEKVEGPAGCS